MTYEKCCRNCEYSYLGPRECKGCDTFGDNKYENFKLREEFAKIENGTMVELPCKVGDTVYELWQDINKEYRISEKTIVAFTVFANGGVVIETGTVYPVYINTYLTREEAEAKLAELKGEKR